MDKRQVSLDESLDYDRGSVLWRPGAPFTNMDQL